MGTPAPHEVRYRILDAAGDCAVRFTLGRTSIDEIARAAGLSRATVYRHFPGGRQEVVSALVDREIARLFGSLADRVSDAPDFASLLVTGLMAVPELLGANLVLQRTLDVEPQLVLPEIQLRGGEMIERISGFLRPYLQREPMVAGTDLVEASRYLARLVLSFISTAGLWDLTDEAEVRRLVNSQFLAGIVAT